MNESMASSNLKLRHIPEQKRVSWRPAKLYQMLRGKLALRSQKHPPSCWNMREEKQSYSHGPVHHCQLVGEVDGVILNGDQDGLYLGVTPSLAQAPLQVHGKFLVGVSAVRHKVVITETGESEDVAVKSFVVEVTPGAADMVSGSDF